VRMDGDTIGARVARSGQPVCLDTTPAEITQQSEDALRPMVARLGIHGVAVVPIRAHQRVIGTLGVMRNTPGRGYTEEDVTLLQDLADRAGLAIDNARLYDLLEQRVLERTAELEATNRELEAFSYSVAHDLRAPLRGMSGFAQLLCDAYGGKLDPEASDWLKRILANARQMDALIDALLSLSRVTKLELKRERIDLTAIARASAERCAVDEPARKVAVTIADGLTADADPQLARAVVDNLLGNAWKFTRKIAEPHIDVGATETLDRRAFFVRDNGCGFDMAYAGKLFAPFQRLHTVAEFPGTGIGLANVQRVVQRHGGEVWATGEVDHGATFYFTFHGSAVGASP